MRQSQIFHVRPTWAGKFRIVRSTGTAIEGEPGASGPSLEAIEAVLIDEMEERENGTRNGEISPRDWLKDACYQVILAWAHNSLFEDFRNRIAAEGRLTHGTPRTDRTIFDDGLVGLFAKHPWHLKRFRPSRLTDPMWRGFRHYIPPPLVSAFNAYYPARPHLYSDGSNYIEPALSGWVKEQRILSLARECPLDEHRGKYPAEIEDAVQKFFNDAEALALEDW